MTSNGKTPVKHGKGATGVCRTVSETYKCFDYGSNYDDLEPFIHTSDQLSTSEDEAVKARNEEIERLHQVSKEIAEEEKVKRQKRKAEFELQANESK